MLRRVTSAVKAFDPVQGNLLRALDDFEPLSTTVVPVELHFRIDLVLKDIRHGLLAAVLKDWMHKLLLLPNYHLDSLLFWCQSFDTL